MLIGPLYGATHGHVADGDLADQERSSIDFDEGELLEGMKAQRFLEELALAGTRCDWGGPSRHGNLTSPGWRQANTSKKPHSLPPFAATRRSKTSAGRCHSLPFTPGLASALP